ncbi:MAG: PTS transporter subunit EIIC [Streptococcaceae bacterium]|jgi:PTS system cellobiose-specific IIC component|nr:PTS transporter subunit EIIC [Streptococcaceae bacterium]
MRSGYFFDKISIFLGHFNNWPYLRAMREALSALMPVYLFLSIWLLGFQWFKFSSLNNAFALHIINLSGLLLSALTGYFLVKYKNFEKPELHILVGIISFVCVSDFDLGINSMLSAVIIVCVAIEVFHWFKGLKFFQINLGKEAPHTVETTLTDWLSFLITSLVFLGIQLVSKSILRESFTSFIYKWLQSPLMLATTSLFGYLLIYSLGNLMFSKGIHQTAVTGTVLEPLLLIAMISNVSDGFSGRTGAYVINTNFQTVYAQMGGTGVTLGLLISVLIFLRKDKRYSDVLHMSLKPGLFEINEPIIFGLPIVSNSLLQIPFVLSPILGTCIGYLATTAGFVRPLNILVPWFTPPLVSGFLASGGDFKVVILQIVILIMTSLLYLPFLFGRTKH